MQLFYKTGTQELKYCIYQELNSFGKGNVVWHISLQNIIEH